MLTGSIFYRSGAERPCQLKRVNSKATGKKGVTERERWENKHWSREGWLAFSDVTDSPRSPESLLFFALSFSQTFQTIRQWQRLQRQATDSSYCLQAAFRSPLRLAMLATSRKKEKGAHTSGCPATKIRGEKKVIESGWMDREMSFYIRRNRKKKTGTEWINQNERKSTNTFLKRFCRGNLQKPAGTLV